MQVKIFVIRDGSKEEIFRCAQRDLFRKYGWPAKPDIIEALKELEE